MGGDKPPESAGPYVITLGNEKGGTGKSTTAVHLAVALLKVGFSVGTIDLDGRQGTLSRYLANREAWAARSGLALPVPRNFRVDGRDSAGREIASDKVLARRIEEAMAAMAGLDFVVIDTPGSASALARLGHNRADTLITPVNDSFVDLDVLAEIDIERREILAPSIYTKLVWEESNRRVLEGLAPIDWIVMRNRLTHIDARNKRDIAGLLQRLAKRVGFRVAPGLGERVVFRELFDKGLTVVDQAGTPAQARRNPSHLSALREIDSLLATLGVVEPAAP
jgi:chromosome partitioning protein